MPIFPVNTHRLDPYRTSHFRVKWDNRYVAMLSKMSPLKRVTQVVEWQSVDYNVTSKLPGNTKFEPVTFERGLTQDRQFLEWAELAHSPLGRGAMSLRNYRKTLTVEVLNLQAVPVMAFFLERAWVSEFQATPELDANANAVAIELIKIEYEGFSRDPQTVEKAET